MRQRLGGVELGSEPCDPNLGKQRLKGTLMNAVPLSLQRFQGISAGRRARDDAHYEAV